MTTGPLCPHCYRPACPWLEEHQWRKNWPTQFKGAAVVPPGHMCPHFGKPLPPLVKAKLLWRLGVKGD